MLGNAEHFSRALGAFLVISGTALTGSPVKAACVDPYSIKTESGVYNFRQTRNLQQVGKPLVSQGQAIVAPGKVVWQVTKPVNIVTTITPARVTQSIEGGPTRPVAGSSNVDPFMRSSGLLQIVSGDLAGLRKTYSVTTATMPNGGWKLSLKPKEADLARFITRIEIAGCERPAVVDVFQANGDSMKIEWSPLK